MRCLLLSSVARFAPDDGAGGVAVAAEIVEDAHRSAADILAEAHGEASAIELHAREEAIEHREEAAGAAVDTAEALAALAQANAANAVAATHGDLSECRAQITAMAERMAALETAQTALAMETSNSLADLKSSVMSLLDRMEPAQLATEQIPELAESAATQDSQEDQGARAKRRRLI